MRRAESLDVGSRFCGHAGSLDVPCAKPSVLIVYRGPGPRDGGVGVVLRGASRDDTWDAYCMDVEIEVLADFGTTTTPYGVMPLVEGLVVSKNAPVEAQGGVIGG